MNLLTFIARGKVQEMVKVGGKQVVVRIQRRVRMGMKDELGPSYILSSSPSHMTIYLYLFGSLHFLIRPFLIDPVLCNCAAVL